jgi:stage II sporulation protein D
MKNKLLLLVLLIQISFFVLINPQVKNNLKYNFNLFNNSSNLDEVKLENYVIGVVAAEMPASFSFESLKAQAVAARTFAYKKIINGSLTYDNLIYDKGQAYIDVNKMKDLWKSNFDEYYDKISNAVLSTKGEIISYNNAPINAYYFSLSNGKTENSSYVFGEQNYLVSVDSSWDKNNNQYEKETVISSSEFKNKLNIRDADIIINDLIRNDSNRVEKIVVNNKSINGVEFRKLFNLRSTDFDINIIGDNVYIKTRGYGHGVGMSQYGANSLALNGKSYKDIIKYYYNNVTITKI